MTLVAIAGRWIYQAQSEKFRSFLVFVLCSVYRISEMLTFEYINILLSILQNYCSKYNMQQFENFISAYLETFFCGLSCLFKLFLTTHVNFVDRVVSGNTVVQHLSICTIHLVSSYVLAKSHNLARLACDYSHRNYRN